MLNTARDVNEHKIENRNEYMNGDIEYVNKGISDINPQSQYDHSIRKMEQQKENKVVKEYLLQYSSGTITVNVSDENKFLFYDSNHILIGQFTIDDVINYILQSHTNDIVPDHSQLSNVQSMKKLIETSICTRLPNGDFKLNTTSPFMNDIDLLMIVNKLLKHFEKTNLQTFISSSNVNTSKLIKLFIYTMTEHTLNVISIISKQLKNSTDEKLKLKLVRYSIGLVYRLTQYLNSTIVETENNYNKIMSSIDSLKATETTIENKLESLKHKELK